MSLKDKEVQLYFGTQSFMRVIYALISQMIKNLQDITVKVMQCRVFICNVFF